jgi:hypothetical protein
MPIRALLISIIVMGLGAACGYLFHELHGERERAADQVRQITGLRTQIASLQKAVTPAQPSASAAGEQAAQSTKKGSPAGSLPDYLGPLDPETRQQIEASMAATVRKHKQMVNRWLADLADPDPAARQRLHAEFLPSIQYKNPGLAEGLGLTTEQEEAMLDALIEAELRMFEYAQTHQSGPSASLSSLQDTVAALETERRRVLGDLLGDEQLQRYEAYLKSVPERRQINQLRARLDGRTAISNEQAARLASEMRAERERFIAQSMQQPGARQPSADYPVYVRSSHDPGSPLDLQFAEAHLKRSEEFIRRLHDRGAAILTREQLRRFDEQLAEQLQAQRGTIEHLRAAE